MLVTAFSTHTRTRFASTRSTESRANRQRTGEGGTYANLRLRQASIAKVRQARSPARLSLKLSSLLAELLRQPRRLPRPPRPVHRQRQARRRRLPLRLT